MIEGLIPAPPLRLPPEVRGVLGPLRAAVDAALVTVPADRRLDLDERPALDLVIAAGRGETGLPRFDAVVSVAALVRLADIDAAARGIFELLAPGGGAYLIEPVAHVGVTARLRASWWAASAATRGGHLERDVPLAFRSNDLLITDLERITMPTRTWPLRRFIDARARRGVPEGQPGGDDASSGLSRGPGPSAVVA